MVGEKKLSEEALEVLVASSVEQASYSSPAELVVASNLHSLMEQSNCRFEEVFAHSHWAEVVAVDVYGPLVCAFRSKV